MASSLPVTLEKGWICIIPTLGINSIIAGTTVQGGNAIQCGFGEVDMIDGASGFSVGDSVLYRLDQVQPLLYNGTTYHITQEIYLSLVETPA